MVPLAVRVSAVLGQDPRQRTLTEQNDLGQALLFDRANPAFRERIQVRALGGEWNRFHAAAGQRGPKCSTELRVTIVQYVAARVKIAPRILRRGAAHLFHPLLVRMPGDPDPCRDPSTAPRSGAKTRRGI